MRRHSMSLVVLVLLVTLGVSARAAEDSPLMFSGSNSEVFVKPFAMTNMRVASYTLAASSGEAKRISTVTLVTAQAGAPIKNLRVVVNGAQFGSSQESVENATSYSFSGTPFVVPGGSSVRVDVHADVLPSEAPDLKSMLVALSGCAAVGEKSLMFAACGSAKPPVKVGFYPYAAFNKTHLPVGTPVWTNIGDNECAYLFVRPLADDRCFKNGDYRKAKIAEVFLFRYEETDKGRYVYRLEFGLGGGDDNSKEKFYRNAALEEAYMSYNLPEKWKEYSPYLILLGW